MNDSLSANDKRIMGTKDSNERDYLNEANKDDGVNNKTQFS